MNNKPLISVVLPTYNQEKFIEETIKSVVNQTYTNLEIIISDDCSTDKTPQIIKRFAKNDKRIKTFFSKKNKGIPYNFNRAFDNCTGEFIAFFSGDDLMMPDKIEKQVAFLQENKKCNLVMHNVEIFDSQTNKTISIHQNTKKLKIPDSPIEWLFPTKWLFAKKYTGLLPTSFMARSDFYLSSRYDKRFQYKHELLFHLDIFMAKPQTKWAIIPEILSKYRMHKDNFTNNKELSQLREQEKFLIHAIVMEKYPQLTKKSQSFIHFTMFENLLFYEIEKKNKAYLMQFYREARFFKFAYLLFAKFLKRLDILFPFFKIVRFILRK